MNAISGLGRRPVGQSRQSIAEHDGEPIPGLPGRLPPGETLLWQGAPDWRALARALHVRELGVYFLVLIAIRAVTAWRGDPVAEAVTVAELVGVSALVLGLICLFAKLSARSTIYTITDRRLVVRYGVALSKAVNIPFAMVSSAAIRRGAAGAGDLSLRLEPGARVPYVMMWPHVRPWRFSPAEPTLRAISDVDAVAQVLARGLAAATGGQVEALAAEPARHGRGLEPGAAVTA